MKKIIVAALTATVLFSCSKKNEEQKSIGEYKSFGKEITPDNAISQEEMLNKYKTMKVGDTVEIKFTAPVTSVCKAKGCWMKLELDPKTETMVKFKDYDFFVPLNADDSQAIVDGKAYVGELSVEDLKHYAEDEGQSEEEIAAITKPETTYNFVAEGVLLK